MTVGLFIKINDFANGYNNPSFALSEHRTALVSLAEMKCFGTKT
jgi:hypothetical protein